MTRFLLATALLAASLNAQADPPAKGEMATAAGTGAKGFAGDGGKATAALLNEPFTANSTAKGTSTSPRR